MRKEVFRNIGGWGQIIFLLLFIFISLSIGLLLSSTLTLLLGIEPSMESLDFIRLTQTVQTIFVFIIPPILIAVLFYKKPNDLLGFAPIKSISYICIAIVLILIIQPFIGLTAYLNELITLPESMKTISMAMKESAENAEKITLLLISDRSPFGIISNIIIIAALAALAEEIFFRGCLQRIIEKITRSSHLAVWSTAIIFSAIHLQFDGFIARMILGAILGYLFVWSRNLWLPIIIHFVNNAVVVLFQQYHFGTPKFETINEFNIQQDLTTALISLVASSIIIYFLYKRRDVAERVQDSNS